MQTGTPSTRVAEIPGDLQRIEVALKSLDEAVANLESRLETVLECGVPPSPTEPGKVKGVDGVSPLGRTLNGFYVIIDTQTARVRSISNRLGL